MTTCPINGVVNEGWEQWLGFLIQLGGAGQKYFTIRDCKDALIDQASPRRLAAHLFSLVL